MATDTSFIALGPADIGIRVEGAFRSGLVILGNNQGPIAVGADVDGTDIGVFAHSAVGKGIFGGSVKGFGVHGMNDMSQGASLKPGFGAGVYGESTNGFGVFGSSDNNVAIQGQSLNDDAVQGVARANDKSGVVGTHLGAGFGIHAHSASGIGIFGKTDNPNSFAGKFEGNVEVTGHVSHGGNVDVAGNVNVNGDVFLANKDLSERFEVNPSAAYEPGMLVVIGTSGVLEPCTSAYDKRAVGVISGAGTLRPAITLGAIESSTATVPVALVGTAFCLMDAGPEPIEAGDLVTTSETPGYAMKAADPTKRSGAVVGKALAPLREGRCLVPMLISLQ